MGARTDRSALALSGLEVTDRIELWWTADDETALVLMPGIAFDPEGHRCGYGGGFYDKYLAAHSQHPTLALCYGFQMLRHLDTDAHDIPVDFVLSQDTEDLAE